MFIFSTICLVIVIWILYFVSKYEQSKQTPPDVDFIIDDLHTTEEILPDDHFQDTLEPNKKLDEMVRLSEEMGLYDEPKKPFLYYHNIFVTEDSPPQIWTDTKGNTRYFVGMQEVTKEGYQWACWVWRDKSPYSNAGTGKNSNVEIYYK